MSSLKNRINHVTSSLLFCEQGVSELSTLISDFKMPETQNLIYLPPFNFYRASLCYLIVMEYCKLFEPKKNSKQLSSIIRLCNNSTFSNSQDDFKEIYNIPLSSIYNYVLDLRDKKFGHSDSHLINKPFNIPLFKKEQLEEIKDNLNQTLKTLNQIRIKEKMTEVISVFSADNSQTRQNLITLSVAKQYYFDFFMEAQKRGYDALIGKLP